MAQLECKDVALGYEGRKVLQHINFTVKEGDYLCVVGENGAGKSTLIKALLGLKSPLMGEIIFGDGVISKEIGYLPQQTLVQRDFPASVIEVVLSGCLNQCGIRPFYRKEEKIKARNSLEKLGIASLSKRCYRELSGGQQQRVLLARALCASKKLLILDEPVAGLDPTATKQLYELIHRLNREDQLSILMVTHDIHAALSYASHILHVKTHPFFGTKDEYVVEMQEDKNLQMEEEHENDRVYDYSYE